MISPEIRKAVADAADLYGIEELALLTLVLVETTGDPFWDIAGVPRPPIRPEPHVFWRQLRDGPPRAAGVKAGLAHPKRGAIKPPASKAARYEWFDRMRAIDYEAACASTSWGLGQVMGFNARELGYKSALALAQAAETVAGQIEMMVRYVERNKLIGPLNRHEWRVVARSYNGSAYAEGDYHGKLERTYAQLSAGSPEIVWESRKVRSDPAVRLVQERLTRLGYECGEVDGIDGPRTREAVRKFQADHGLVADGIAGQMTAEALDAEIAERGAEKKAARKKATVTTGAAVGGITIGGIIAATLDKGPELLTSIAGMPWQVGAAAIAAATVLGSIWMLTGRRVA